MTNQAPLRPALFTITEREGVSTLRGAVEWYKRVYRESGPLGSLTGRETAYINEQWAELCKEVAEVQGVPAGMLSYWLNELATNEIQLERTAQAEGIAAQEYPSVPSE